MAEQGEIDPVLIRISQWAADDGLTREAVAQRLGVSRTAVAGWFLALEARGRGEAVSRSARTFRFTSQRPEVQHKIAEALALPIEGLRAESLTYGSAGQPSVALGPAPTVAPGVLDLAETLLGQLASGELTRTAETLRHRTAEIVETVPEVVGTLVVPEFRGSDRDSPYQHQIVVFVGRPEADEETYRRECREKVNVALAAAEIPLHWEHGAKEPDEKLEYNDSIRLGSLVCPLVEASRPPQTGLLVAPFRQIKAPRDLRIGAVVTSPYGGGRVIAGLLAEALRCGHVRAEDLVRWGYDVRARRTGDYEQRLAFLSDAAERDAGFVVHHGLYSLHRGTIPGAWLISIETKPVANYSPLQDALIDLTGILVIVHLGPQWRRLAAWRLAAADLNTDAQQRGSRERASSDQIDLRDGAALTKADRALLGRQRDKQREWLTRLTDWEEVLADIGRRRADRSTVRLTLDPLPDPLLGLAYAADGTVRQVTGRDRLADDVAFPDDAAAMVDAWTEAAGEVAGELARLVGHTEGTMGSFAAGLASGRLARLLGRSYGVAGSP